MKNPPDARRILSEVLSGQRLAVLATQDARQPYTSLVAFAATPDLKFLLFATARETRKYANIKANSRVAMLMDTRSNRDADFHAAVAITATGAAVEARGAQRARLQKAFLAKHPHLDGFVRSPTCALIRVKVKHYYIVSNFQSVTHLQVKP